MTGIHKDTLSKENMQIKFAAEGGGLVIFTISVMVMFCYGWLLAISKWIFLQIYKFFTNKSPYQILSKLDKNGVKFPCKTINLIVQSKVILSWKCARLKQKPLQHPSSSNNSLQWKVFRCGQDRAFLSENKEKTASEFRECP